ncbi:MAG: GNAT family N-acetyltransferase [Phycisphaeraceae bacterium]|nr:GNAT family N-acetyltransferase [Phycisphaeraceae bacterium]
MPLQIDTYRPDDLPAMVALYNDQMAPEPFIAPLTPDLFTQLIASKSYFDPAGLFVAREQGQIVGWSHAAVAHATETWMDPTNLFAGLQILVYRPGDLHVGLALVAEAVRWLRAQGHTSIHAIDTESGNPFYRGLLMGGERLCPASLPHVHLALSLSGFKLTGENTYLVAHLDRPPHVLPARLDLDYVDSPLTSTNPAVTQSWLGFAPRQIEAFHDGRRVAHAGWVMLPYHTAKLGSPCVNLYMLSVSESHRRQGIAAALVTRAFALGHQQGARIATLNTEMWNLPAHRTYHKLGMVPHRLLPDRRLDLASLHGAASD